MNNLEKTNRYLEYFLKIGKQGCMIVDLSEALNLKNRNAHNIVKKLHEKQLITRKKSHIQRGKSLASSFKINTKGKKWLKKYAQYLKVQDKLKSLQLELKN